MTWDKTKPVSGTKILATPSIFSNNWGAMDDILSIEHYGMTSALSGRHNPGEIGVMYTGTNAEVAALTSPLTGAMACTSAVGSAMNLIRGSNAWKIINYDLPTTRVLHYTVSVGTTHTSGTQVAGPFQTGPSTPSIIDSIGEFGKSTFTSSADGYFFMSMTVAASSTMSGGDNFTMGFSGNTIQSAKFTTAPSALQIYTYSTIVCTPCGVDILPFLEPASKNVWVSGGSYGPSYLNIWRIS